MSTEIYSAEQLSEILAEASRLQSELEALKAACAVIERHHEVCGMGPLSGFLYPVDVLLTGFVVACETMRAQYASVAS